MVKAEFILDYKFIKEQIDRLLESVVNKLEREWPQSKTASTREAHLVLVGTVKVVGNTFKTIRFLCSEKSADWRHRAEMALTVPPLARTILDALYTFIFLFEDLPVRAEWYVCSGWRELAEYIDRAKRDYGSDAVWEGYFDRADANLAKMMSLIGKPSAELRSTRWWPTPQQMRRYVKDPATGAFFSYLDDWFYREFSQVSHITLPGLIHTAGALLDRADSEEKIEQMRGYHFMQVVMLLTSLYSEVEAELKLGVAGDLKYVWEMVSQHYPLARQIYDKRGYASRLG